MTLDTIVDSDAHIALRIPSEEYPTPAIDLARYGTNATSAAESIASIMNVLRMPYIVDDFTDHAERREWQTQLEEHHPGIYERVLNMNALSGGNWTGVFFPLRLLGKYEERTATPNKEYLSAVEELMKSLSEFRAAPTRGDGPVTLYDKRTVDEKIAFIQDLKRRTYETLSHLTNNSAAKSSAETHKLKTADIYT